MKGRKMEDWKKIEELAKQAGFACMAYLDCGTIELLDEVRKMCETNSCGMYGKNWACPPGCGDLEECRRKVAGYCRGLLVQTVGELEDSMDFEGMQETERRHKKAFYALAKTLRTEFPKLLPLGAGCCSVCRECTCPEEPCRFPDQCISSMESYGILVSDLCKKNNLSYYYGPNKIAYTSCYLLD